MEILPKSLGTRPRLAVEIRAEGVAAARAADASAILGAASRVELERGLVVPALRAGNIIAGESVVAAVRSALDAVSGREHGRDVTVVIPDGAARVLLLEFDELPSKAEEALAVVRFRLKKLVPFDVDTAAVSFQVMASAKGMVEVLAVAMPREVLAEYEAVVVTAGYMPGAVLPSTLAALAGLEESQGAALVVNAGLSGVTTAIAQAGVLLLHRTLEFSVETGIDEGALVDGNAVYDRIEAEASMESGVLRTSAVSEAVSATWATEVTQAVSVAVAYFEDRLTAVPEVMYSAGPVGAEQLNALIGEWGMEGVRVREMVDAGMIEASAASANASRNWLAGVRGALKG
jgi:type IV pilus assembly protein PilM